MSSKISYLVLLASALPVAIGLKIGIPSLYTAIQAEPHGWQPVIENICGGTMLIGFGSYLAMVSLVLKKD